MTPLQSIEAAVCVHENKYLPIVFCREMFIEGK